MITSKQRAKLRSLASNIEPVFQVGKAAVSPELVNSVDEALEKRELIKGSVLDNCMEDIKSIAQKLSERTGSELVQIIGRKIVLFRANRNDSKKAVISSIIK